MSFVFLFILVVSGIFLPFIGLRAIFISLFLIFVALECALGLCSAWVLEMMFDPDATAYFHQLGHEINFQDFWLTSNFLDNPRMNTLGWYLLVPYSMAIDIIRTYFYVTWVHGCVALYLTMCMVLFGIYHAFNLTLALIIPLRLWHPMYKLPAVQPAPVEAARQRDFPNEPKNVLNQ